MAGVYSKAYQEVIAGRVREDEQIAFYGDNRVAVPGRTVSFVALGGKKMPVGERDYLNHPGVGKRGTVSDVIDFWLPNSYTSAVA
jgi:hypothetical protein